MKLKQTLITIMALAMAVLVNPVKAAAADTPYDHAYSQKCSGSVTLMKYGYSDYNSRDLYFGKDSRDETSVSKLISIRSTNTKVAKVEKYETSAYLCIKKPGKTTIYATAEVNHKVKNFTLKVKVVKASTPFKSLMYRGVDHANLFKKMHSADVSSDGGKASKITYVMNKGWKMKNMYCQMYGKVKKIKNNAKVKFVRGRTVVFECYKPFTKQTLYLSLGVDNTLS